MDFNIYKYDNQIFHEDELIHGRIKALLIWYEFRAFERGSDKDEKLMLIDEVIKMCVKQEWFEIATFFSEQKIKVKEE